MARIPWVIGMHDREQPRAGRSRRCSRAWSGDREPSGNRQARRPAGGGQWSVWHLGRQSASAAGSIPFRGV